MKWKMQIELEVSENWVEDGFNMSDEWRIEKLKEHFTSDQLPYAYDHEVIVKVKIISAPAKDKILEIQGY